MNPDTNVSAAPAAVTSAPVTPASTTPASTSVAASNQPTAKASKGYGKKAKFGGNTQKS